VHFQRSDRCDNNDRRGVQSRFAAFYIQELFRAEIGSEAGLSNGVVGSFERHALYFTAMSLNETVQAILLIVVLFSALIDDANG